MVNVSSVASFMYSAGNANYCATKAYLTTFMWLSAASVVRASLRRLDRRGPVVCVPGPGYEALVLLIRLLPRRTIGWIASQRRRM